MRFSDSTLQQIRDATNIVDLVAEHVRLRKRGKNWIGLCPFHNEKTPSFNVLEDRAIFKCFGCGKGGDVFSFVMGIEGLTFPEAAERLAKRANIELSSEHSEEEDLARSEREGILETLRAAAGFYYRTLHAPEGAKALDYLKKRGLDDEVMRKFGLGFAPEQSGQLTATLIKQGYSEQMLEAGGVIARRDNGDTYERFRGRVIFPVFSPTGRIVGFGGRVLPGAPDNLAKYINSPDTSVYHKSQILYGLFQGKDAIRKKSFAVLVEGYADVLSVFQAGVENVVAASGTSLTSEQLNLLKRYTTSVVLLFDADTAGKNAAIRGIELAIEAGFDVNTVVLPSGEDPDSFIRAKGNSAFEAALERRQSWIETKAQWHEEQGAFKDPGRMAGAVRSIVETIAKVPDSIKRALFIQRLGERFHLSEQMLTLELQRIIQKEKSLPPVRSAQQREAISMEDDVPVDGIEDEGGTALTPAEATLLEAMLHDPIIVARVIDDSGFDLSLVTHAHASEIIGFLMQEVEGGEPVEIAQLLDEYRGKPEHDLLVQHGMSEHNFSERWDDSGDERASIVELQARQAMARLETAALERALTRVRARLNNVLDERELTELQQESMRLVQRIQVLRQDLSTLANAPSSEHV